MRIENPALVIFISAAMVFVGFSMLGLGTRVYCITGNVFYAVVFKAYGLYLLPRYGSKLFKELGYVFGGGEK